MDTAPVFHCPRWNELPTLPLYMDQVVFVLEETFAPLGGGTEQALTPAMINNYVKKKILPPPVKKKYSRDHLALLVFLGVMKRTLSMAEVSGLWQLLAAAFGAEAAYDTFSERLEQAMSDTFLQKKLPQKFFSPGDNDALHALDAALVSLTGRLYVQQALAAGAPAGEPAK